LRVLKVFLFSLLLPLSGMAQYVVSGKVLNLADKNPVGSASIFLSNTTVGTKTGDDGSFVLTNVRAGQYDLVISSIGFETFHKTVMVNGDVVLPAIEILSKSILLKEVKVKPNDNWDRDYQTFKRWFLGNSSYADDCKILNPDLLQFDYDASKRLFTATSSDYLVIENKALGYKIRYLLTNFSHDGNSGILYFEGPAAFEYLKGSDAQQKRWQKNRLKAYEGSSMHFLRSAIANTIAGEGFKVLRLIRKLNPDYKTGANNKYSETLVTVPLSVNNFVKLTDIKGEFALGFDDCLYVMYDKKHAHNSDKEKMPKSTTPDYLNDALTSTIIFSAPYAYFDSNGVIINPDSVLFEGYWTKSVIPGLLPVDYVP